MRYIMHGAMCGGRALRPSVDRHDNASDPGCGYLPTAWAAPTALAAPPGPEAAFAVLVASAEVGLPAAAAVLEAVAGPAASQAGARAGAG